MTTFFRRAAAAGLALAVLLQPSVSVAAAAVEAPVLSPAARRMIERDPTTVCLNADVETIGWQGWRCTNGHYPAMAGTVHRDLRIEALSFAAHPTRRLCAQANVEDLDWQPEQCTGYHETVTIGTAGRSLQVEAVRLSTGEVICARGYVENINWQTWRCSPPGGQVQVGTEGHQWRIEALRIRVRPRR